MAHQVICKVCGQKFDRDKYSCVLVSPRRYAHKECAEKAGLKGELIEPPQRDPDLVALENYIMKLFDEPFVNARIRKQIKDFQTEYNYTYSGMLKTLVYWFDVKGHSTEDSHGGIGIIPYVYAQARDYFYNLYLAQQSNANKNIEKYKPKERVVSIPTPFVQRRRPKLFFAEDDEEEEEV